MERQPRTHIRTPLCNSHICNPFCLKPARIVALCTMSLSIASSSVLVGASLLRRGAIFFSRAVSSEISCVVTATAPSTQPRALERWRELCEKPQHNIKQYTISSESRNLFNFGGVMKSFNLSSLAPFLHYPTALSLLLDEIECEGEGNGVEDSVWCMSSTLKKRRAKMNKHKLRKRRKKLRLKSKK
uniref:Small ribosomal subunit protein mS38 n=1 Tax=Ditylum brightwellii TaxID=49249 RepID=A0A7S1ZHE7_9STRA